MCSAGEDRVPQGAGPGDPCLLALYPDAAGRGAGHGLVVPLVLRDMDVASQSSRVEACTNLPVKEAMACCAPVIAAPNTGMLDLLTADNSILLMRQTAV